MFMLKIIGYKMKRVKENNIMEEMLENIRPIQKVTFYSNTQEQLGVEVNLTKGKEYEVLSVRMPAQYEIKPAVDNAMLFLIKDDLGEKHYFLSNCFRVK